MTAGLLATDPLTLGPFRLLGRLGGGGMGQVYLGEAPSGELVAVKVIRPEFAEDPEFRVRFGREVANARNVSGRFTAQLADADTQGPVPWLATAYVPGPPLSEAVRTCGPLPLTSLLPLATGLAQALAAIHGAGVVHRDLKPSNVLLAPDGPRVIDFGISHAVEASTLTQSGAIMGSPGYMSPEQAQGLPVGPESDIFSFGAVLAFAASGVPPFGAGSVAALVYRVVSTVPGLDQVPPLLRPLIERCLAKQPGDRPALDAVLAEFGGGLITRHWLPESVAATLTGYQPSARVAGLAGRPDAATPAAGLTGAGLTGAGSGDDGPGSDTKPGRAVFTWSRPPRQALVTAAAVLVLAIAGTWLAVGPGPFGAGTGQQPSLASTRHGTTGPSLTPGATRSGSKHTSSSATATRGVTSAPVRSPSPGGSAPSSPVASPDATISSGRAATTHASSGAARTAAPVTTAASSGPPASGVSAAGATVYSCSSYPLGGATLPFTSDTLVNNTSGTISVNYVESATTTGLTGDAPADQTTPATLATDGVYKVEDASGNCLGVFEVTADSGTITVS